MLHCFNEFLEEITNNKFLVSCSGGEFEDLLERIVMLSSSILVCR